jgi:hypothetical protein
MPMIFHNPAGAPELACEHCGCRWFDRITGTCYECGTTVPAEASAEYERALAEFAVRQREPSGGPAAVCARHGRISFGAFKVS